MDIMICLKFKGHGFESQLGKNSQCVRQLSGMDAREKQG